MTQIIDVFTEFTNTHTIINFCSATAKDKKITPEGLNTFHKCFRRFCLAFYYSLHLHKYSLHLPYTYASDFEDFPKPTVLELMEMAGMELIAQWREVGQVLGFEGHELDAINANNQGNVQKCMNQVFQTWRDREGHTSNYSWETLAEAIRSPVVNRKALLQLMYDRLKAKYN